MQIGLLTDALSDHSLTEVMDLCVSLELEAIELTTGNWSTAPHLDANSLLEDSSKREAYLREVEVRGLAINALNASGNPLHPTDGARQQKTLMDSLRLAHELEVDTVVTMSGLPGGGPNDQFPNFVSSAWPPETQHILRYQWEDVALPYWDDVAQLAKRLGVEIAIEPHANQLVYNVPTALRLREAVGSVVGVNLDPSHLMWMGADPLVVVPVLGGAIKHVHMKDVRIEPAVAYRGRFETLALHETGRRAWNYCTLGHGNGQTFWRKFCSSLRSAGYDGALNIEHEDVQINAVEGVTRAAEMLRSSALIAPTSWRPQEI